MKKIVTTALITGAVAAAIIYLFRRTPEEKAVDDITGAAKNAFNTMDKHINRVESATESVLGGA